MLDMVAVLLVSVAAVTSSGSSETGSITVAEARQSLLGRWQGKLEYRDYQSGGWSGNPVEVNIKDGGDGVTPVRTADYDDGPRTGNVRITTVSMLAADGVEESAATFRKGRPVEVARSKLALEGGSASTNARPMIETSDGTDDGRPATLRLTTTRKGRELVTLKEVDFKMTRRRSGWCVTGPF